MKVYCLFQTHSDDCTWSSDELLDVFLDENLAEYVADALNNGQKYPIYSVQAFESFDGKSLLKTEERITFLKNRNN